MSWDGCLYQPFLRGSPITEEECCQLIPQLSVDVSDSCHRCRVIRGNDVGIIITTKFPHVGMNQSNSFNSVEGRRIQSTYSQFFTSYTNSQLHTNLIHTRSTKETEALHYKICNEYHTTATSIGYGRNASSYLWVCNRDKYEHDRGKDTDATCFLPL